MLFDGTCWLAALLDVTSDSVDTYGILSRILHFGPPGACGPLAKHKFLFFHLINLSAGAVGMVFRCQSDDNDKCEGICFGRWMYPAGIASHC